MRLYPAVDVRLPFSHDDVLAVVDDFSPTAAEECTGGMRVFFTSADARDAACAALRAAGYSTAPLEVGDGDWARRSQEGLGSITIGRLTILPSLDSNLNIATGNTVLIIPPSTGFGTGHHATTRYCLMALQRLRLENAFVLDVGTGSGVLALAAARLGAARALGVDIDDDAIRAARENLAMNPSVRNVRFELVDMAATTDPSVTSAEADIVTANLTGTLLVRLAPRLLAASRLYGHLVLAGLLDAERHDVVAAFAQAVDVVDERRDDEWVGLTMKKR